MTCPCMVLIVMIDTVILAVAVRTVVVVVVVVVEYSDLIFLINKAVLIRNLVPLYLVTFVSESIFSPLSTTYFFQSTAFFF
jgi:hypothetical protein